MKKNIALIATVTAVILTFSACGNKIDNNDSDMNSVAEIISSKAENSLSESSMESEDNSAEKSSVAKDNSEERSEPADESRKTLVAYFTLPEDGSDADAGASRVITADGEIQGNVEYFAKIIAKETGADIFQIETIQEYPRTHEPLVDQADEERDNGARPELATHIENLDDYDTIFIGFPIWWYDMPMAMNTFFEEYDFSGKIIVPFSSHGGSGFSTSIDDIAEYEPNSEILEGFTVERNEVPDSADDLKAWIAGLDI
ncbi:MAG: flavodoxin [Ruminococcus sp.]|nr:flavodoxin [Ruminococcus sp.]